LRGNAAPLTAMLDFYFESAVATAAPEASKPRRRTAPTR
jgi:hypothetical protein